jgi:hypothetical protein
MPYFVIGSGRNISKFQRVGLASTILDNQFFYFVRFVGKFYFVLEQSGPAILLVKGGFDEESVGSGKEK